MNKADLNRKIQLLEQKNEMLKKNIKELVYCECEECSKKREIVHKRHLEKMKAFNNLLKPYYEVFDKVR